MHLIAMQRTTMLMMVLLITTDFVWAFVPPSRFATGSAARLHQHQAPPGTSTQLHLATVNGAKGLVTLLFEKVISTSVPILVYGSLIFLIVKLVDGGDDEDFDDPYESDIYYDTFAWLSGRRQRSLLRGNKKTKPPREYLTIREINDRFSSYQYTMTAATENKFMASNAYNQGVARRIYGDAFMEKYNTAEQNAPEKGTKEVCGRGNSKVCTGKASAKENCVYKSWVSFPFGQGEKKRMRNILYASSPPHN